MIEEDVVEFVSGEAVRLNIPYKGFKEYSFEHTRDTWNDVGDDLVEETYTKIFYAYENLDDMVQMLSEIEKGRKISAIRIHRNNTKSTLKEAKHFIEGITFDYNERMKKELTTFEESAPEYFV